VPEVQAGDARLFVDVEGAGEPVTVFCHGLTNSRLELAPFTPLLGGTKVRFDFRGHGLSESPPAGSYRFDDFARDLRAVAEAYGATRAVGTSLGAGALCRLLLSEPDRFERIVLLLPAGIDRPFTGGRFLEIADLLEAKPLEDAVAVLMADPERRAAYESVAWLEDFERANLLAMNPTGVPRAVRGILGDAPVPDPAALASIEVPTLVISREGDTVHPLAIGQELARLLPRADLIAYETQDALFKDLPDLIARVTAFLAG